MPGLSECVLSQPGQRTTTTVNKIVLSFLDCEHASYLNKDSGRQMDIFPGLSACVLSQLGQRTTTTVNKMGAFFSGWSACVLSQLGQLTTTTVSKWCFFLDCLHASYLN